MLVFSITARAARMDCAGRRCPPPAAGAPIAPVHDGRIHLQRAGAGEYGAAPGIEQRLILQRHHGRGHGIERRAATFQYGPTGGESGEKALRISGLALWRHGVAADGSAPPCSARTGWKSGIGISSAAQHGGHGESAVIQPTASAASAQAKASVVASCRRAGGRTAP